MISFIKIAYCCSAPLLLLLVLFSPVPWKRTAVNLIAVSNLLLIGNTIFFWQQLQALYEFAVSLQIRPPADIEPDYWLAARILGILALPVLSLVPAVRRNHWFTLVVCALFYSFYTPDTWYLYDSFYKIIMYLCLVCAAYALLWLLKMLPYQSSGR